MAPDPRRIPPFAWGIAASLVLAHLLTLGRYGIFRDELYYVANGRHLAWGYVDHPPLVAALAWLIEHTIGTSVYALRLPVLLALVGVLAVLAALVRRLGGSGPAVAVAWLAFALGPYYLFAFHYLSMNAPEVLWWSLAALLLMRATDLHVAPGGAPGPAGAGRWLLFGAVMGLAALTKVSGLVWGAALAVAVLVSPARRHLLGPWPWAAVLVATLMFAPHVLWQVQHGWPTAEFVRNAQEGKIVAFAPAGFLLEQLKLLGPVGTIVSVIGLAASLTGRVRGGSVWAVTFLVTLLVFLVQRSKPYYMMPAYPVLLVAGAVAVERWRPWTRAGGRVALFALAALGTALVPLTLPVLPPERVQAYMRAIGVEVESGERHEKGALPQHFADMFGWETLADDVARVVGTLTPAERATARIYAQNYGEAGALDYYGPARGLPPVISGHNAYWHWGPGPDNGGAVIIVGGAAADHREVFRDVTERGQTTCTLCMPYEQDLPIFVARGLKRPLREVWPAVKHFE
jgi:hypothetical protein